MKLGSGTGTPPASGEATLGDVVKKGTKRECECTTHRKKRQRSLTNMLFCAASTSSLYTALASQLRLFA